MRLKAIVCDIFFREFCHIAATTGAVIDAVFLRKGLHDKPDYLRGELQEEIDRTDEGTYDAIVLLYGLCGKAADSLTSRHTKLVLPRVHDCIAVFLGSLEDYMANFQACPGSYYYTSGAWERGGALGVDSSASEEAKERRLKEYIEKYGEDNALYLLEAETSWTQNYKRVVFIDFKGLEMPEYRQKAQDFAIEKNLEYHELVGRFDLIDGLLSGSWDDRYIVIEPGHKVTATDDARVMAAS